MSRRQWQEIYDRAWHLYYSPRHVETLLRRARASGIATTRMVWAILCYYGSYRFEKVHPLQCGVLRRKVRTSRRPGLPRENPFLFYPRRLWEALRTYAELGGYFLWLDRVRQRVDRTPDGASNTDAALARTEPAGTTQAA